MSLVHRPSSLRSPARGCGNPQLRPSPRLSSLVHRKPQGIQWGPQPPGRWGRIPRPYSPECGAAPQAVLLEDSGETSFSNRSKCFDLSRRSRGNLAGIRPKAGYRPFTRATTRFPLACLCLLSPRRESRPPEATGQGNKSQRQKANPQRPGGLPAAAGTGGPLRRGRRTGDAGLDGGCGLPQPVCAPASQ